MSTPLQRLRQVRVVRWLLTDIPLHPDALENYWLDTYLTGGLKEEELWQRLIEHQADSSSTKE